MESRPSDAALLVMDYQKSIVETFGNGEVLDNTRRAIEHARGTGIPVIYIVVRFRPGHPEVHPLNKSFTAARSADRFREDDPETAICDEVAPADGEVIVVKHRTGAFSSTELDQLLRATGVSHLVLAGVSTSGVVLSTVRAGADNDYRLTVLSDCCADRDKEVHDVLMTKVFRRQADVVSSTDWMAGNTSGGNRE
jgi:nicotinamidase-related amidase